MTRKYYLAIAMMFGSTFATQFGAVTASKLFPDLGVVGTATLRLLIAGAIIVALARPRVQRWDRRTWITVIALGASMAGMNASFYAAIDRIPLGIAVSVELLGPLTYAAILSRRASHFAWTGIAMAGVVALGISDSASGVPLDTIGLLFAASSGMCWAIYIPLLAKVAAVDPGVGPLGVAMGAGGMLLTPLGGAGAVVAFSDARLALLAIVTALLGALLPYGLELMASRHVPQRVFGVLASREPVIAAGVGLLLMGQVLPLAAVVAIGAVVVAAIATALGGHAESTETEPLVVPDLPSAAEDDSLAPVPAAA
ncbi:EamA family transporter [Rarobacter incanus]|uniref:Inner membrane transporter RhtA n=1 Tax=Rarobacter incanus TaxID=153494 RepID=A0A542SQ14_9MICO|nr:EamA family transporter [Rarobacter incanus]TQK76711.1 inner membrane transporter RhtA [Rarobacter incanus]